jgi:EmrB/QacA subfamily drug resistance transporter
MDAQSIAKRFGGFDPRWLALCVTAIGSFMSILDTTVVNIALPSILRDFDTDLKHGQLVLTVYLLALAVVIPLSGFLAERVGIKRLYMITLACFVFGSVLCGFAWNLPSLIAFRALQGLGGGMLQPLGMAMVFTMITPLERGRFMGVLGLPMLLAPLVGPTVGGYLVEFSSWRTIFLINLPVGLINLLLAYWLLKEQPRKVGARFDGLGFALALLAFPGILLTLSLGEGLGWGSPITLTLAAVGVGALIAFAFVELRQPSPLLQLRLFKEPIFTLGMAINFVTQFSLFGIQYILPLLLQTVHGLGAAATGLLMFPSGILSFITMNVSGRIYNRVGPRPLAASGLAILLLTTFMLGRTTAATSLTVIGILAALRGLAMGLCMMPVQTAAYNTVPRESMPRATALTNMLFRMFGAVGTAILTTTILLSLRLQGAPEGSNVTSGTVPQPLLQDAFSHAFLAMSILAAVGIAMSFFLHDRVLDELRDSEKSETSRDLQAEPAD